MSFVVVDQDGRRHRVAVVATSRGVWVGWPGGAALIKSKTDDAFLAQHDGDDRVTAPMTGKVVNVAVAVGDVIDEGALLVVLEAMKMEYRLTAPHGGKVSGVACKAGDLVDLGAVLVTIEN